MYFFCGATIRKGEGLVLFVFLAAGLGFSGEMIEEEDNGETNKGAFTGEGNIFGCGAGCLVIIKVVFFSCECAVGLFVS